jgi:hypothetical protein
MTDDHLPRFWRPHARRRRLAWILLYLGAGLAWSMVIAAIDPSMDAFNVGLNVLVWPLPVFGLLLGGAIYGLGALVRAL